MNIKSMSSEKLRVDLSCDDLDRYDLDYMSISNSSPGTKRLLKEILTEAGETVGFSTTDCKLLIEVLPGKSNGCVLYLTKMPVKDERKRRLRIAEPRGRGKNYILTCRSIEDTINAINCFTRYPDIPLRKSSLYNLADRYLLTFSPIQLGFDENRLLLLLAQLSEYGDTSLSTEVKEAMLAEHGHPIHEGRAIENFIRYFH